MYMKMHILEAATRPSLDSDIIKQVQDVGRGIGTMSILILKSKICQR